MTKIKSYNWSRRKRFVYVTRRTLSLTGLLFRLALTSRGAERQATFDRMCDFMYHSGGVYTKFLQSVLLGTPEVKDWMLRKKVDFFEHVPEEDLDVTAILRQELGEGVVRIRMEEGVLASGTFAQVYAGTLDLYQPVVVKIQRQTIRPSLKADVWLLKKFARFGRTFMTSLDADVTTMSRDFARLTLAEMDYEREARLGELLRERAAKEHQEMIIPKTFGEISTEHVLIQERLGGVSLAELSLYPGHLTDEHKETLKKMMSTVLLLPFTTGLVHADPHPGNIRLIDGNHFALLDFGAVDDKPVNIAVYRRLLLAALKAMDGKMTAAEALDAYFASYAPRLHRAIEVTARSLGLPPVLPLLAKMSLGKQEAIVPQDAYKGNVAALANINKLVNPGNRFALRSSLQNLSYARAVHTIMNTMQLLDLHNEMILSLHDIGEVIYKPTKYEDTRENALTTAEAKEIVYSWLERVVEKNPLMASELNSVFVAMRQAKIKDPAITS